MKTIVLLCAVAFCGSLRAAPAPQAAIKNGLRVSDNHRYLVDAKTGAPVFILADTAWNLGALKLDEIDAYLQSRAAHGFNTVMFALSFAPQADEKNAYGQPAYSGADKTGLNAAYFETSDAIVQRAADRGLFVVIFAMWAGEKAGTMNRYTAAQLRTLGRALGDHYAGVPNVIFCAGGEASPPYIDVERVNAIGAALKVGCQGRNLVTVHPVSENSSSRFYAASPWLDFYLSQAKSGNAPKNTAYDAAALVLGDWNLAPIKPTMMAEHRYESGTTEDPLIQRRSLYQCVFAGGFGYAYGHDALWQMSPHTAKPWMLKGWTPGVDNWTQALDTPAARQLHQIKALLYAHPYLTRIPDQSLVMAGQGGDIFSRVQATRDGTPNHSDATYLMAYLSASQTVTLNTAAIGARTLKVYWFNPATGATEVMHEQLPNPGRLTLEKRPQGGDWVVVVEDAAKKYPLPLARSVAGAGISVPRWEAHDFAFTAASVPENPFQVAFSAEVTGPDGAKFTLPGFYDGDNTWKIRVSAPAEGAWSLVTRSPVAALDGKRAAFACIANRSPAIHGSVRLDAEHPHQFVSEDGTRFLPMGYECDWLWALDANDPELKTINPFLDKLTAVGFNLIVLNAYAHDTTWRKGHTGDDDFGPPPLYAWAGTNEQPDHSRFNLAFWQHYDRVIDALYRRGIWAHVLIKVYNKRVNWPANGTADDEQYFRWLIARYAAYPNLTWDLAKEANYEKDLGYKLGRLQFIRANDPYHRLLTVHDDRADYDRGEFDGLVDYRSDQQHKAWREVMLAHLQQRAWPVINTEFGYEHGPAGLNDKTYNAAQSPEEVVRRAWEVYLAGGFGVYYYTYTAWDVIRVNDTPPGYADFKYLHDFLERTAYWRMRPIDGLASAGSCLAEPGREYVVFLGQPAPFTLKIDGAAGPLVAEWYQPLSGQRRNAGAIENGIAELNPPSEWLSGPVALHVGSARR